MRLLLAALLLMLAWAPAIHARTWYVELDGSGEATTVQSAIDSASAGDSVVVGPGEYLENINFSGKEIVVKSRHGPESTVLLGNNSPSAIVTFDGSEGNEAILEGFRITGGVNSSPAGGGGIDCGLASPLIRGNIIADNSANWGGGLLAGDPLSEGSAGVPTPIIEGNVFSGNSAVHGGGGIMIFNSNSDLSDNVFLENHTMLGDGGGLHIRLVGGNCSLQENEFWGNQSGDKSGAIHVYQNPSALAGECRILHNLFANNVALGSGTGDSGAGGGVYAASMRGAIKNNTFVNNESLGESACGGGAIMLSNTWDVLQVSSNIIAFNEECGIACGNLASADFGVNLLWMNPPADLGSEGRTCPSGGASGGVFADPQFCGAEAGDFTVAASSPAIVNGIAMGAFPIPGCGPVAAVPTTWGRLKALYR